MTRDASYRYQGDPNWDPAKLGPTLFAGIGANHAHDGKQPEHGTRRGYDWHKRRKNKPCAACLEANRVYRAELRAAAVMRGKR